LMFSEIKISKLNYMWHFLNYIWKFLKYNLTFWITFENFWITSWPSELHLTLSE
jgi:hypothetical protein